MARKSKLSRGEKALLIAVSTFVGLFAAIIFYMQYLNRTPLVVIPPPPPWPNPNARDYYINAAKALTSYQVKTCDGPCEISIDGIFSIQGADFQPGAGPGVAACVAKAKATHYFYLTMPSRAEVARLLQLNAPALAMMRQGLQYEFRDKFPNPFESASPELEGCRKLESCLFLDIAMRHCHGDWYGIVQDELDDMRLGESIANGGRIINFYVGTEWQMNSCELMNCNIWQAIDHLTAEQTHEAAKRLKGIVHQHTSYAEVLQEEERITQSGMMKAFSTPGWRNELAPFTDDMRLAVLKYACTYSKQQVMDDYTRYMQALIAYAGLPYAVSRTAPAQPKDPYCDLYFVRAEQARFKDIVNQTQNNMLLVSFALRSYYLEHGRYPATLQALVPGYLQAVPADPFALSASLHYHLKGAKYLLYSIGPDGIDNGGTPSNDGRNRNGNISHSPVIEPQSTGDIVAGVNVH